MSVGAHHNDFDLWNSKYQPRWKVVATGPKIYVVGTWRKAAERNGLRFAVSDHLSNSYNWPPFLHLCDLNGLYSGVPYDGTDPENADVYHNITPEYPSASAAGAFGRGRSGTPFPSRRAATRR